MKVVKFPIKIHGEYRQGWLIINPTDKGFEMRMRID